MDGVVARSDGARLIIGAKRVGITLLHFLRQRNASCND